MIRVLLAALVLWTAGAAHAKCDTAAGWPPGKPCRDAAEVGVRDGVTDKSLQAMFEAGDLGGAGGDSFGTIGAAVADSAGDTLTVTDSGSIDFTSTDNPEDLTAIALCGAPVSCTAGNPIGITADGITMDHLADSLTLDASLAINTGAFVFDVNGTGAFAGDLVDFNQNTGNPTGGSVLHLDASDPDISPVLHVSTNAPSATAGTVTGILIDTDDTYDASFQPLLIRDTSGGTPVDILSVSEYGTIVIPADPLMYEAFYNTLNPGAPWVDYAIHAYGIDSDGNFVDEFYCIGGQCNFDSDEDGNAEIRTFPLSVAVTFDPNSDGVADLSIASGAGGVTSKLLQLRMADGIGVGNPVTDSSTIGNSSCLGRDTTTGVDRLFADKDCDFGTTSTPETGEFFVGTTSGGASPPATCRVGDIWIDTDETVDTNCTTTNDNVMCICNATDTWIAERADSAGGSGDSITVEDGDNAGTFTATVDADFEDSGDINFVLTGNDISGQIRSGAVGTTEAAALDAADVTTGTFGDALIDGSLEADEVNPTLGTQTQGNFVASVATTAPITGGAAGSEGATLTLALNQLTAADLGADSVGLSEFTPDPASDDQFLISSSSTTAAWDSLADCEGTANKVTYDADTNNLKCETDQTSAGGGITTVEDIDSSPTYTGLTKLSFNQADGFVITNPVSTEAQIDQSGFEAFSVTGHTCAASTSYLGLGSNTQNCDTTESNVDITHVGPTMTVGNLKCTRMAADATCDLVVTIRKNGADSGASTCSFANAQGCAASTTTDTIANGDTWSLKETSATTNCSASVLHCTFTGTW